MKLETALRTAGEWKAKAFKALKTAKTLKSNAEDLKARAQLTIDELRVSLDKSEVQRATAEKRLSAVEQQLSLYQLAVDELRDGKSIEDVLKSIRLAGGITQLEEGLSEELKACQEELERCRDDQARHSASEAEWAGLNDDLTATRAVLENKIGRLEQQNSDLKKAVADLNEFKARGTTEITDRERDLRSQLRLVRSQLSAKTRTHLETEERLCTIEAEARIRIEELHSDLQKKIKTLKEVEDRLALVEGDTHLVLEDLHMELESTREELGIVVVEKLEREQELEAQIVQLEDAQSDLEIVNVELYQRIAELDN